MQTAPPTASRQSQPKPDLLKIALLGGFALCLAIPATGADWYVLCERDTGRVVVAQSIDPNKHVTLDGPFPGQTTASIWIEENCPGQRCNRSGACDSREELSFPAGSWIAACDPSAGEVVLMQAPLPQGFLILDPVTVGVTSHDDPDSASSWISEACPSWECDTQGNCTDQSGDQSISGGWVAGEITSSGGWVAGEVSSTQHGTGTSTSQTLTVTGPPGNQMDIAGPENANLQLLVNNSLAAADACAYPAALASTEHLGNFEPQHPWLVANLEKLRRLSSRQQSTQAAVWQSSSALQSGNFKQAKQLAESASTTAVTCQNQAVAQLLQGIDTAIEQQKRERRAKTSQAMSALLPTLINLSNAISGQQGTVSNPANIYNASPYTTTLPSALMDPCAFKYEYRNKWTFEPTCTCPGYTFNARTFRCTK